MGPDSRLQEIRKFFGRDYWTQCLHPVRSHVCVYSNTEIRLEQGKGYIFKLLCFTRTQMYIPTSVEAEKHLQCKKETDVHLGLGHVLAQSSHRNVYLRHQCYHHPKPAKNKYSQSISDKYMWGVRRTLRADTPSRKS